MPRKFRFVFIFIIIFLVVAVMLVQLGLRWLDEPVSVSADNRIFIVSRGQSLYGLADSLHEKKLITFPKMWAYYARFVDKANIKAGEYELEEIESARSLLDKFKSAKVIQYKLTFIEGTTAKEAIELLAKQEKLVKTLPEVFDISQPDQLGLELDHLEGWLYPDTYYYSSGDTDFSILQRAHARMQSVLSEEWANRDDNLPFESPYEALILASIVEKETGAPHEREQIAGVFVRRLDIGMRLGTDPTVIYGMGDRYNGNITRADLKRPTPYNTYTNKGLPPTPIALAGRAAIRAALHPEDGEALYFVAKGDGTHYFSKTLDEHLDAVKKYQLTRKKNYRSNFKAD